MFTLKSIIQIADKSRPGYAESIGFTEVGGYQPVGLPTNLMAIYQYAVGTPHDITEQSFMDFLPGDRLMLATEIPSVRESLQSFYGVDELFNVLGRTPFLTNYSSDYFLTADDNSGIYWLDHSQGTSLVSPNLESFLETVKECYVQGAYFLADDGFLDVNDDLEFQIGVSLNPDCEFWLA